MYCTSCGHTNDPGSRFCECCGAPIGPLTAPVQPAGSETAPPQATGTPHSETLRVSQPKPRKRKKKNIAVILLGTLSILLAATIALMAFGVTDMVFAPQPQQKNFDTPEDAIRYFISCAKDGDYESALFACPIEQVANNFDYQAFVDRSQVISPGLQYLPSEYDMYEAYNENSLEYALMQQLSYMAMSVSLPEEYASILDGYTLSEYDVDFGDAVENMDPEKFFNIEIVEISESASLKDDTYQDVVETQAEIYGADKETFRAVLYMINGDYYVGGFTLLQYGESWLILSLNDATIGQSVYGTLIPVEGESEFSDILGGDYTAPETTEAAETAVAPVETTAAVSSLKNLTIGLSLPYSSGDTVMAQDIARHIEQNSGELISYYANYDASTQASQIQTMISMGVDALVVDPLYDEDYNAVLQQALDTGIPVIMVSDNPNSLSSGVYSVSISHDFVNEGKLLTEWVAANIGDDIGILEIAGSSNFYISADMSEGLRNVLDTHPGMVLLDSQYANYTADEAKTVVETALDTYGDSIDVIFCQYCDMAMGAIEAVENKNLTGQVTVVSLDGNYSDAFDAIQSRDLAAICTYNPLMGEEIVGAIMDLLNGKTVEKAITVPDYIFDASNVNEMADYLY
jgi:ABC-type sugar transport system substrate-binding protein